MQVLRKIFPWMTDDYDKIPAERVRDERRETSRDSAAVADGLWSWGPVTSFLSHGEADCRWTAAHSFPETLAAWHSPRGYVENVAAAIALAATDQRAAGRIYNVCEEPSFSELEWARKIAAEMRWDGELVVLPVERTPQHLLRPDNAAQHWRASSARIRAELGYEEPVGMEEAIRRTIAWELENPPDVLAQFDYAAEDAAVAGQEQ